jgi:hypothetical protein
MIKRIKKFIDKQIRLIVREELDDIFCKNGEIAVDHHIKQNSWAVIKIDSGPGSCYLKFVDLDKDDLIKIQKFMSQFERQHIDAAPHIEHEFDKIYDIKNIV